MCGGLAKQIVVVLAEINLAVQEFLGSLDSRVGQSFIKTGNLDLLLVLVHLFEVVSMTGKLFQFGMELLFHGNIDLIGAFGYYGNRFI
jgi:hypothetical protein